MHTAKTLAGGGEQGGDQAIRCNSTTGEPLGEWGVMCEEGCVNDALVAMHGEGEQDQSGEGGDHEGVDAYLVMFILKCHVQAYPRFIFSYLAMKWEV